MMALISQRELKPYEFRDKFGEKIIIRLYDHRRDREKLIEMYEKFDPEDRCLGLPPLTREGIERWIDYLAEQGCNIVAEHEGKIVGHVAIVPLTNKREVELDIFVLKDYQGRGIGQELLRYAIEYCRSMGFEGIYVLTECLNFRAKRLFKKFGFVVLDEDGDETFMYLKLNPS